MSAVAASLTGLTDLKSSPRCRLAGSYAQVRAETELLCESLATDDYTIQSMPDVSPPKWHLAHTTWFFENFLLAPYLAGYQVFHPRFGYLFNSYYQSVGAFQPRASRALSRPTVAEVYEYREHVDVHLWRLLDSAEEAVWNDIRALVRLGLHHEQQHQELLLTDIKHIFASNPLRPEYHRALPRNASLPPLSFIRYAGGVKEIGHAGNSFAYDNELPRHPVLVSDYALASRLVSNAEFMEFIAAGGYQDPRYWLSDGWNAVQGNGWQAPLYWQRDAAGWNTMTLAGMLPVAESEPVCHVSLFEADAYARWANARLPTEAEWELAAANQPIRGNFRESGQLQPQPLPPLAVAAADNPAQLYGDVWEWTQSAYSAYPGYRPLSGALAEYNGKFMCNQFVLRGGSCATPQSHMRASYRNFFPADARWQFTGIRLAHDASAV